MDNFWADAEVIHAYTRKEALADGVLVDVTETSEHKEAGFTMPVAVTRAVWELVEPERMPAGQSVSGRLWDLLWMLRCGIRASRGGGQLLHFKVIFGFEGPRGGYKQKTYTLKAMCGPGDDAEPVLTILLPEED